MKGEAAKVFPFQKQAQSQTRPSSLPLPVNQRKKDESQNVVNTDLQHYADNLVDGVIKTVSETKADCLSETTTEITVTDTGKNQEIENLSN